MTMTGRTHKAAGGCAMLGAFMYLMYKGYLVPDIHPIVQLAVMYPIASWGSTMPDLDQSSVQTIPDKTPMSIAIYYLLHIGKIKHRSWQTHSLLTNGLFIGILSLGYYFLEQYKILGSNTATYSIILLMLVGLSVGILSHLLMDALTYEGIQIVPKVWFHPLHIEIFKTNTVYEKIVRILLYVGIAVEVACMCYIALKR